MCLHERNSDNVYMQRENPETEIKIHKVRARLQDNLSSPFPSIVTFDVLLGKKSDGFLKIIVVLHENLLIIV